MKSPICDLFGIEFPLLAFSHCRDVVVEVSKAGGIGVLGLVGTAVAVGCAIFVALKPAEGDQA